MYVSKNTALKNMSAMSMDTYFAVCFFVSFFKNLFIARCAHARTEI